jgi:hypothetical protein
VPNLPATSALSSSRRWPSLLGWVALIAQFVLIEIVDAANDIVRGDLFPPSARDAVDNARQVVRFEVAHGFFLEPALYRFAQHSHGPLGITLTSDVLIQSANTIYAFFHIGVPILVGTWLYIWHHEHFGPWRNVLILVCIVALAGYLLYPVAPPRLTTGIIVHGRPVHFGNTMPYPTSGMLINGHPLGANPYAAMPSLHIAWATTNAAVVALLARHLWVRLLTVFYPILMTLAVVVTANHYIMDGVGGVFAVCIAVFVVVGMPALVRRRSRLA